MNTIASNLRTQTLGNQAGFYIDEGREIPIEVRSRREALKNRDDLFDVEVFQVGEQRVPIVAVGEFIPTEGVDSFQRRDRETVLDVNIRVDGDANAYREKIISFIQSEIVLPEGYRYEFTGGTAESAEGFQQFFFALIAAILLMYMIMASLFENFRDCYLVVYIYGCIWCTSFLGTFRRSVIYYCPNWNVVLVGIIVNNGIVLRIIHLNTRGIAFDPTKAQST